MKNVNFKKKFGFPLKYFRLLYYPGMRCYTTLLSNFRSIICEVVVYGRLKTTENVKLLEVVAVAYESRTRGSKYSVLRRGGRNRRFDCILLKGPLSGLGIYHVQPLSLSVTSLRYGEAFSSVFHPHIFDVSSLIVYESSHVL